MDWEAWCRAPEEVVLPLIPIALPAVHTWRARKPLALPLRSLKTLTQWTQTAKTEHGGQAGQAGQAGQTEQYADSRLWSELFRPTDLAHLLSFQRRLFNSVVADICAFDRYYATSKSEMTILNEKTQAIKQGQSAAKSILEEARANNYLLLLGRSGTGRTVVAHLAAKRLNKRIKFYDIPTLINSGTQRLPKPTEACIQAHMAMHDGGGVLIVIKSVASYKHVCKFFVNKKHEARNAVLFIDNEFPRAAGLGTLCKKQWYQPLSCSLCLPLDSKELKSEQNLFEPIASRVIKALNGSHQNLQELKAWMREELLKHGDYRAMLNSLQLLLPLGLEDLERITASTFGQKSECPFVLPVDACNLFQFLVYGKFRERFLFSKQRAEELKRLQELNRLNRLNTLTKGVTNVTNEEPEDGSWARARWFMFDALLDHFTSDVPTVIFNNLYAPAFVRSPTGSVSDDDVCHKLEILSKTLDVLASSDIAGNRLNFEAQTQYGWTALQLYGLDLALPGQGDARLAFNLGERHKWTPKRRDKSDLLISKLGAPKRCLSAEEHLKQGVWYHQNRTALDDVDLAAFIVRKHGEYKPLCAPHICIYGHVEPTTEFRGF